MAEITIDYLKQFYDPNQCPTQRQVEVLLSIVTEMRSAWMTKMNCRPDTAKHFKTSSATFRCAIPQNWQRFAEDDKEFTSIELPVWLHK